jgi:hypothetical protein
MKILCFEVTYIGFKKSGLKARIKKIYKEAENISRVQGYYTSPLVECVKLYREYYPAAKLLEAKAAVEKMVASWQL